MILAKSKKSGITLIQHTRDVLESCDALFGLNEPTRRIEMLDNSVQLWAKGLRRNGPPPPTVEQHCRDVYDVAVAVWESVENDLATALQTEAADLRARLRPLYLVSAMLHDAMKANSVFQDMLAGRLQEDHRQPVRHEVLAAVMMADERFWGAWLAKSLEEKECWMVAWAVAGHHLKIRQRQEGDQEAPWYRTKNVPATITIHFDHPQTQAILATVRRVLNEHHLDPGEPPQHENWVWGVTDEDRGSLQQTVKQFVRKSE